MPPGNALEARLGQGWTETQWLTHDVGEQLRDMQLTQVNMSPWVKGSYTDKDIRTRITPPDRRIQSSQERARARTRQASIGDDLIRLLEGR